MLQSLPFPPKSQARQVVYFALKLAFARIIVSFFAIVPIDVHFPVSYALHHCVAVVPAASSRGQ